MSIWSKKISVASELRENLLPTLPSDVEFSGAFAIARVARPHLARYYLRAMEMKVSGGDPCMIPNPNTDVVNLEHVLPENPDPSWKVRRELAEAFYKRIGNLALLETPINSSDEYGNKTFATKQPFLASATFKLTKEIAEFADWGPEQISQRQQKLAELAVKTWPL